MMRAVEDVDRSGRATSVAGCADGGGGLTSPSPLAVATRRCHRAARCRSAWQSVCGRQRRERQPVVVNGWRRVGLRGARRLHASQLRDRLDQHLGGASLDRRSPAGTHFARVHAHNWCGTSASSEAISLTVP